MADNWHVGNAVADSEDHRGWLVGHFLDASDGIRASEAVEIKWGIHPEGEERHAWHTDEERTTLLLLIKGRFRLELSVGTFVLQQEGDYAIWGPGTDHSWRAEEDAIVITVRWPSLSQ
ncbi:MAG: signal peptidase I [Egibacteraceae bacterium]